MNRRMLEDIKKGEALDVSRFTRTRAGDYVIPKRWAPGDKDPDPPDYCDVEADTWIWSVGKNKKTGRIHASTSTKFYQNPDYECLWLR